MMAHSFEDYIERATSMLADGFTSEAARKNALDYVNRAFDFTMSAVGEALLKARDAGTMDDTSDAWRKLYYDRPACHVWKEKHAVLYAAFPHQVAQATHAATLRSTIKAAQLVAKQRPPHVVARERAEAAKARTCQICGRQIFAEVGMIAHHGYQRPGGGTQTASCPGARELPFETSRDRLRTHITNAHVQLGAEKKMRASVAAETAPIMTSYEVLERDENGRRVFHRGRPQYTTNYFSVTRATIAQMMTKHPAYFGHEAGHFYGVPAGKEFSHILKRDLAERDRSIKNTEDYLTFQHGRYDAWQLLEKWNATTSQWEKI